MTQLLIPLYFSSAVLCALTAAGLLLSPSLGVRSVRLLGINYALYSVQQLLAVAILAFAWTPAVILRPSTALALGPALYFYYLSLTRVDSHLSRWHLLHLLPSLVLLAAFLFDLALIRWTDVMIVASFTCYSVVTARLLPSGVAGLEHLGPYAKMAYRWLLVLAGMMLVNLLVEIGAWIESGTNKPTSESWVILFGIVSFLLFNLLALVLALVRAPLMEWMHGLQALRLTRATPVDDEAARKLFTRWQELVLQQALYKRENGISLEQAGRMLGVPARQVSIAVNRVYGGNFSQYLNDCRVVEARRLLLEQPGLPITTLMMEAGFSTKSNFNKEFKRVTGMSPREYRENSQAVQSRKAHDVNNVTRGRHNIEHP